MNEKASSFFSLHEDRFARLRSIDWWEQEKLASAKVLIIGAGALGNEVIKNLALLGLGHMVIVDMDRVEMSNLSRSVLFREQDRNCFKAECAARTAKELFPGVNIYSIKGNVMCDVGFGFFKWADIVVGALDNREARVFVNKVCALVSRPWIDGGIEVLNGIVRGFAPPATACYECTMSKIDWEILDKRKSCSLLARHAELTGHIPTTATTASIIGAIQAQEVIKFIHNKEVLMGRGYVFEGEFHNSFLVNYSINPKCERHELPPPIKVIPYFNSDTPLQEICDYACQYLTGFDAVEFEREIVHYFTCPNCKKNQLIFLPIVRITPDMLLCDTCNVEYLPSYLHGISAGDVLLKKTVRQIGLPAWDILWVRYKEDYIGIELDGDNPFSLKEFK